MGKTDYDPNTFWDRRYAVYGHTGYMDELIYSYDQPMRLKAVKNALSRSGITLNSDCHVLDAGCGVGDLINELSKKKINVTGVDISAEVITKCQQKFKDLQNVTFLKSKLEEIPFPHESYDLVVSITVLQHILDPNMFSKALKNIVRVTKRGGHILIFESSPIKIKQGTRTPSYIALRTREEWITFFKQNNCSLLLEFCLPKIGIRVLGFYGKVVSLLFPFSKNKTKANVMSIQEIQNRGRTPRRLDNLTRKVILSIMKPFDLLFLLIPFPKNRTDLRILIFEKGREN